MNNQGTQKNPVRKAKTSGQIRRPLSHRVMSMLLTFLMVFTTVMPYTAFAEDSVLTDGAGDMELVGVSSGANGTEAEIVDASGDGESSLITDQADASSASGAQGSDSSAASGAGSDGSADASLDDLFEDEPDAASTDAAASEDTGAANTYLNEDTRTVYLVNRNSYADLQLWNENKTGTEADFWVQHVEKADNVTPSLEAMTSPVPQPRDLLLMPPQLPPLLRLLPPRQTQFRHPAMKTLPAQLQLLLLPAPPRQIPPTASKKSR